MSKSDSDEPCVVRIYGASNDLIGIEGFTLEEFIVYDSGESKPRFIATSGGALVSVCYTAGIWRLNLIDRGTAVHVEKVECPTKDDDEYTDVITLKFAEPVRWVTCSDRMVKP